MSLAAALALAMAAAPSASAKHCDLPAGWQEVVGKKHYVIFGELHGTEQSPQMFGETACALAHQHKRLLVAVELKSELDAGLQKAWALPHAEFAENLPRLMPEWTIRNDGVTSQAMLAMLVRLHALKSSGSRIDVAAFNGVRDDAQSVHFAALSPSAQHEVAQAANIRKANSIRRYDRVLVLVGMAHARKRRLTNRGETYEPMAMRLAPSKLIASLNMIYAKGTTWDCEIKGSPASGMPLTSEMIDCNSHVILRGSERKGPARIIAGAKMSDNENPEKAYDGGFFVGPISASPPAVAQR